VYNYDSRAPEKSAVMLGSLREAAAHGLCKT